VINLKVIIIKFYRIFFQYLFNLKACVYFVVALSLKYLGLGIELSSQNYKLIMMYCSNWFSSYSTPLQENVDRFIITGSLETIIVLKVACPS
jgi:hypothetical protein